jgi:predicted negative regulator of RcsB-dependent stress response
MATSHYKIKPKDLKAPDEFVTQIDRIGNYLANNVVRVIVGAAVVIAVAAVIFTYAFYRSHQAQVVADRFYDALTALNHKDYKTAEEGFDTLAQSGSGNLAGLARLYAASAYMSDNKPTKARDALEAYVAESDQPYFKNLALVQMGVAYEDLGDFKKAHAAYAQAASTPGPEKSRAVLGVARTLMKQGDNAGAIAAYRSFLAANPLSTERAEVTESLATLTTSPTSPSPSAPSSATSSPAGSSLSGSSLAPVAPAPHAPIPAPTPGAPAAASH